MCLEILYYTTTIEYYMLAKYIAILYIGYFQVIHLDGLFVNHKHAIFSSSNILYDLIVSTNTKFNMIKCSQQNKNDGVDSLLGVLTDIENCLKHAGPIRKFVKIYL